jgi:hypothetical protein
MTFLASALILSWVAIVLLALVVARLVQQVHQLQHTAGGTTRRPDRIGLRPGTAAPSLASLGIPPGEPAVLLFLSASCSTCAEVLVEAAEQAGRPGVPLLHALYEGAAPAAASGATVHERQAELFERYDAIATPFAVVLDRSANVVRSEPIGSRDALRRLLVQSSSHSIPLGGAR